MKTNKMKGFTLVELLAVIVILAIILVIAVPKVMSVIEDSKKATLESTAKMIAGAAEKVKVQNTVLGKDEEITCDTVAKINKLDYETCEVDFEDNTAKVTIKGSGKFEGLNVCNGTKTEASATSEECKSTPPVLNCTYDGDLVQGAEFVHNQYTYRYKQEYTRDLSNGRPEWSDIEEDGWGVILTDKDATNPINTPLCTYINDKPLLSTSSMLVEYDCYEEWGAGYVCNSSFTKAESIDMSLCNTSTVINMSRMFESLSLVDLDFSELDTSNVENMHRMFEYSEVTKLDLSGLDTSNVTDMSFMFHSSKSTIIDLRGFNTSNVTDMGSMFRSSAATSLDLSSFDTSNVTNMHTMFGSSKATTGYARTEEDAARLNNTYLKPSTLTFTLKSNG